MGRRLFSGLGGSKYLVHKSMMTVEIAKLHEGSCTAEFYVETNLVSSRHSANRL
jgi:hypothetical protein